MVNMNVTEVALKDIRPYEKNPRYNDQAVKPVMNSIQEFGFRNPIIVDKDNVIVCGHTRYKAAMKLKLKTVPVIKADDLTEEQIAAYRLADNKVASVATWDQGFLSDELDRILDIDMSLFGFTAFGDDEPEPEEKDMPEGHEEIITCSIESGEIYQLGDHKLMCGNPEKTKDICYLLGLDADKYGDVKFNFKGKNAASIIINAEKKGTKAVCIEAEPRKVQEAISRWEEMTGKKAVKVSKKQWQDLNSDGE